MEQNRLELLDAAACIGRQQAFALVGSKCSAAQAQSLREIRDSRLYERFELTWDEFCPRYAAISRSTADDLIRRLEEFGEAYFRISEISRISPEAYRQIAGRVQGESIDLDGEAIPLTPENAPRIRLGLRVLRAELSRLNRERHRHSGGIVEFADRLDHLLRDLTRRAESHVPQDELAALRGLTHRAIVRFRAYAKTLETITSP